MITDDFKPCCYECNYIDFDYDITEFNVGNETCRNLYLTCKHNSVCHKYWKQEESDE